MSTGMLYGLVPVESLSGIVYAMNEYEYIEGFLTLISY